MLIATSGNQHWITWFHRNVENQYQNGELQKMAHVRLERSYLEHITYGRIYVDDVFITECFELAWNNNKSGESCIREGEFLLEHYNSPRHADCFIVHNENLGVTKFKRESFRWGILFHVANQTSELAGCIAPVSKLNWIGGSFSRKALNNLSAVLNGSAVHTLTIKTFNPTK